MPNTAIWFGRLLVLVGIIGYAYGMTAGNASVTALIPAAFGIVLMICGHLAVAKEGLRKTMMHIAIVVALIGFIAALGGIFRKGMPQDIGAGIVSGAVMALICLIFVILCIRSFVAARRS